MLLGNLIKTKNNEYKKINLKGVCFDSRKVKKKDIFFAIKGEKRNGEKFVNEAIQKGASAIVVNNKNKLKNRKTPFIYVKDVRKSLAEASSNFYKKKPSNIIAVTGTNGKSSVANFFYQILNLNKISAASIGTLGIFSKKYNKKTDLTSLDSMSLHRYLEILSKKKINHVILEASSHGLQQKRLDKLIIKTGIFTNLSHDHLDYHKNMNSYFKSKMYLFKNLLNKNSEIITDKENKEFKSLKKIAKKRKLKIHAIGQHYNDIKILENKYKKNKQNIKISFKSKNFTFQVPLIGFFQIKNLLMAILAARNCGLSLSQILKKIDKIKPVPGRLENVKSLKNNSNIIIDFAHTPHALEQSIIALKDQFKKKIVIVFGCGGERDKKKRHIMGKIAKRYCHKIYITDDNPRNENPKKIRNDIIKGCKKNAFNIASRKKAIETAIEELNANEVLLIAGKGHENTQNYGKKIINFSDKKIIKEIINRKKFKLKKKDYKSSVIQQALGKNIKNLNYTGVSINTKTIKKNELFFAIKGKKLDGHKFAKKAILKGAIKSVISKKVKNLSKKKTIKVKNTLSSLNNLAKITRENSLANIIGITGSVGKTTLKNLLGFALKTYGKVYNSPLSYNNKFGVPLSIANLKGNTEYGIFEIGMDKKGEIDNLSKIVNPEIAVITNISNAHLKNFKSLKDIAKAKSEIINNISKRGYIILNKDDKFYDFLSNRAKSKGVNIISFSHKKKADISFLNIKKIKKYYKLKVNVKGEIFYFNLPYSTESFINNILACISVLSILNLNLNKIRKNFIGFNIPSGRGDVKLLKKFGKKFNFIDESYNANSLSMYTAIKNMDKYKFKKISKKIILLGDMLELGKKSKKFHKDLSTIINKSSIDRVYVYGNHIKTTFDHINKNKKGKIFSDLEEAYKHFAKIIDNNDLLMVKGSNATGLNQFSKNIKRRQINAI